MIFTQKLDFFLLLLRFCSQKTIIFLFCEIFQERNRILTIIKSKITYSLDNFPCQLTFMSKPISIYILCLHQLHLLTRRAIPSIYFKSWPVSSLAALRNPTQKIKTYISEKQNYNSSAAQRVYQIHISQPTIRNRYAEQTCNFFRGNICLYFLL